MISFARGWIARKRLCQLSKRIDKWLIIPKLPMSIGTDKILDSLADRRACRPLVPSMDKPSILFGLSMPLKAIRSKPSEWPSSWALTTRTSHQSKSPKRTWCTDMRRLIGSCKIRPWKAVWNMPTTPSKPELCNKTIFCRTNLVTTWT